MGMVEAPGGGCCGSGTRGKVMSWSVVVQGWPHIGTAWRWLPSDGSCNILVPFCLLSLLEVLALKVVIIRTVVLVVFDHCFWGIIVHVHCE